MIVIKVSCDGCWQVNFDINPAWGPAIIMIYPIQVNGLACSEHTPHDSGAGREGDLIFLKIRTSGKVETIGQSDRG